MRRLNQSLFLSFLSFLIVVPSWGGLSKTYPTAATTVLRLEAYIESFKTGIQSTDTIKLEDWQVLGSCYTWIPSNQSVNAFWTVLEGTVPVVVPIQMTLNQYTDLVYQESQNRWVNNVLDEDIEQYLVWIETGACPSGWKGWGRQIINNKVVAIPCP